MKLKASPLIVVVFIALVALACTFSPASGPAASANGYRYDNLPDGASTSATIAEYKAISAWDKTNITYFFLNGTSKIAGDHEKDLVRAAFGLWAAQTPLTFTEAS